MTGGWQPLCDTHSTLSPTAQARLHLQAEPLTCHHLLLAAADVLQLMCPLQFDQFYWAECMAHLGCSPAAPLSLDLLLPQPGSPLQQQRQQQQRDTAGTHFEQLCSSSSAAGVSTQCTLQDENMEKQQHQWQQPYVVANTAGPASAPVAGVAAAAAYLAGQVQAARQAHVIDSCSKMKEVIAQENGLHKASCRVMEYMHTLATQ